MGEATMGGRRRAVLAIAAASLCGPASPPLPVVSFSPRATAASTSSRIPSLATDCRPCSRQRAAPATFSDHSRTQAISSKLGWPTAVNDAPFCDVFPSGDNIEHNGSHMWHDSASASRSTHSFSADSPSSLESSYPHGALDFMEPPSSWLLSPCGRVLKNGDGHQVTLCIQPGTSFSHLEVQRSYTVKESAEDEDKFMSHHSIICGTLQKFDR